jgi:hypothetical protein
MTRTTTELHNVAITFPDAHQLQIRSKAAKWGMDPDDVAQEARLIILEKGDAFDPARGSFPALVFGHLEKRMLRQFGAHRFATSLDSDSISGQEMREFVESLPTAHEDNDLEGQIPPAAPGAAKILSIAGFASGKSAADLAPHLGKVTPRRVRQIFQKLREDRTGLNQFELCFDEGF